MPSSVGCTCEAVHGEHGEKLLSDVLFLMKQGAGLTLQSLGSLGNVQGEDFESFLSDW